MGRQQSNSAQKEQKGPKEQQQQQEELVSRPKRRATNAHIFRYLQTRNPSRLEENDLKRALEVSLEECPDFWPEDSASCSSSEQSNSTSATLSSSGRCSSNSNKSRISHNRNPKGRINKRSLTHPYHLNHNHHNNTTNSLTAANCCPMSVHNRYKPVAKKNIYNEADFFHDGIMEYIEYQLTLSLGERISKKNIP